MNDCAAVKEGESVEMMEEKKLTYDTLKELQRLLAGKEVLDTVKSAVMSMNKECINTESKIFNFFNNMKDILNLGATIINNLKTSELELIDTSLCLITVFRKREDYWKNINKLSDQCETYCLVLEDNDDTWCRAVNLEKQLLHRHDVLIDDSKSVINTLQDHNDEKDIEFLNKLKFQAEALMLKTDVKSALTATAYVNLYFQIAMLQSLVLWLDFCLKHRCGNDQSSTKAVYSMIKDCQKSNIDMLRCFTNPKVEHALFLSVCHITDNENILHFLQVQNIEPHFFDESFYARKHYIHWSASPEVKLQMANYTCGIWSTNETNKECEFNFESVEGLDKDNICYIKSAHWSTFYIIMKYDGSCVPAKQKPEKGGKWKIVSLDTEKEHSTFIISSVDWLGKFLYLESPKTFLKSTINLEKILEKGLWKICDV